MTNHSAPKVCVIGWPIKHSRSPLIHNYWLKYYGIDGSYEKKEIAPPQLNEFIQTLRQGAYAGCNVTIPHKQAVSKLVDDIDPAATRAGSLNTLYMQHGRLKATSTDGQGFLKNLISLQPNYNPKNRPVVMLGAGGSARAIADTLLQNDAKHIYVFNRTAQRAQDLATLLSPNISAISMDDLPSAMQTAGLLINTTSAGLMSELGIFLPWDYLHPQAVVADIVYTPLVTPFLHEAAKRGNLIVPGLGMLLHQAVVGFEKWFGVRPEVTHELHDLVARDINPDYQS